MLKSTLTDHGNAKRRQKSNYTVFDADDVDWLTLSFNLPQLRRELHHAEIELAVCRQFHDPLEHYWRDYAGAIKLAVNIARCRAPRVSRRRGSSNRLPQASDVKARNDAVDTIGQYVRLRKSGRNFRGLCPLHNDREPSLMVYPDDQRWRCYGCNQGGDVITFTMLYHNCSFRDAIKYLAGGAE